MAAYVILVWGFIVWFAYERTYNRREMRAEPIIEFAPPTIEYAERYEGR
jgi:hypothetical protein